MHRKGESERPSAEDRSMTALRPPKQGGLQLRDGAFPHSQGQTRSPGTGADPSLSRHRDPSCLHPLRWLHTYFCLPVARGLVSVLTQAVRCSVCIHTYRCGIRCGVQSAFTLYCIAGDVRLMCFRWCIYSVYYYMLFIHRNSWR